MFFVENMYLVILKEYFILLLMCVIKLLLFRSRLILGVLKLLLFMVDFLVSFVVLRFLVIIFYNFLLKSVYLVNVKLFFGKRMRFLCCF